MFAQLFFPSIFLKKNAIVIDRKKKTPEKQTKWAN